MRRFLLMLSFLICGTFPASGSTITYNALIDTSPLAGTTGSLDFNFQAGPFGSRQATVQIANFIGGLPSGSASVSGDVSGTLPRDLSLNNRAGYNDYFQAVTFGSLLSFDVVLSGPAVGTAGSGSGSTFAFSIFSDSDGTEPAFTSNSDGFALTADINADGSTTFRNYTTAATSVSVTPELPTGPLVLTGIVVALMLRRRHSSWQRQAIVFSRPGLN